MLGNRSLLVLIAAALYVAPLLLDAPLTDPDEGLHAAISQEMVERGDWMVPRFVGTAFLDKPILFFWAQAASVKLFGATTAAARLPGLLFALLGVATTGWLARLLLGSLAGGIATVCYATMVLPFLLAQAPVHDIALVPFTNLALGFLLRSRWIPAGLVLGLSILTKGFEGVAIVGVAFSLYLFVTRTLTWRLAARGLLVVAIAALVALPWYLAMVAREPGYLHYYFVERHLLGFATQTQEHSGQPWWFYLPLAVAGGLPWIAIIRRRAHALLWTWLVGTIVLLSLSGSKAVTYLLPAMPAIAIAAAASARQSRPIAIATATVFGIALFGFGPSLAQSHSSRDLAHYFNAAGRLPRTIFVFDQRVAFVYYLHPQLRAQLQKDQIRSVSVEQLAAMQPFPHDAVVTLPADLAPARLPRIPSLAHATRAVAGRYLIVSP